MVEAGKYDKMPIEGALFLPGNTLLFAEGDSLSLVDLTTHQQISKREELFGGHVKIRGL
jgi:hypothetical protein